jgi:hypothetical protein
MVLVYDQACSVIPKFTPGGPKYSKCKSKYKDDFLSKQTLSKVYTTKETVKKSPNLPFCLIFGVIKSNSYKVQN